MKTIGYFLSLSVCTQTDHWMVHRVVRLYRRRAASSRVWWCPQNSSDQGGLLEQAKLAFHTLTMAPSSAPGFHTPKLSCALPLRVAELCPVEALDMDTPQT
jgi:hypothetical protein